MSCDNVGTHEIHEVYVSAVNDEDNDLEKNQINDKINNIEEHLNDH